MRSPFEVCRRVVEREDGEGSVVRTGVVERRRVAAQPSATQAPQRQRPVVPAHTTTVGRGLAEQARREDSESLTSAPCSRASRQRQTA